MAGTTSSSSPSSWKSMIAGIFLGFIVGFSFSYMGSITTIATLNNAKMSESNALTMEKMHALQDGLSDLRTMKSDLRSLRNLEDDVKLMAKQNFEFRQSQKAKNSDEKNRTKQQMKQEENSYENELKMFKDKRLHKEDDRRVADELYDKVRVLCWVMTQPKNLEARSRHIKNTWGKRCNKLLFFSSVGNDTFPTIGLGTGESRNDLQAKTSKAFRYVYEHHYNDYDWFMRTDDDAYVILENLRYFLSGQDTNGTYYFGHHFKVIVKGGYFSGGPGIVVGKKALKLFAEQSLDKKKCRENGGADDVEFGKCLYNMGIYAGNSSDILGRNRFYCFDPGTHLMSAYPDWYLKYDANGAKGGIQSMSDYAIGFHYVNPTKIYELEWFVYHLRPYGITFGNHDLNQPIEKTKPNILPGPTGILKFLT